MGETDLFQGKTDAQVLALARAACRRAESLPLHSPLRRAEWDAFDAASAELTRRAMLHVLSRIREMEARGDADIPDPALAAAIVDLIERNGSGTGAGQ